MGYNFVSPLVGRPERASSKVASEASRSSTLPDIMARLKKAEAGSTGQDKGNAASGARGKAGGCHRPYQHMIMYDPLTTQVLNYLLSVSVRKGF